jgi:hypothetical protein
MKVGSSEKMKRIFSENIVINSKVLVADVMLTTHSIKCQGLKMSRSHTSSPPLVCMAIAGQLYFTSYIMPFRSISWSRVIKFTVPRMLFAYA